MTQTKWRNPTNQIDYDTALDSGKLFCAMGSGKFWQARRNGATKTWKRDPSRFYIPIKFGFKGYHAITETDAKDNFRIAASSEDAESN